MSDTADKPTRRYTRTGLYIRNAKAMAKRDKRCEWLVKRLFIFLPHLQPGDRPTAKAWAQLEILSDCAYTELRENGIFSRSQTGEVIGRRLLEDFRKLKSVQLPYSNALGLNPMSRVQLKVGKPDGLDLPAIFATQSHSDESDAIQPYRRA